FHLHLSDCREAERVSIFRRPCSGRTLPKFSRLWAMSRLTLKACASAAWCRLDMNDALPVKVTPALVTTLFAGASLFAIPAVAQSYPSKPVRLIVPFALGGRPGSRRRGCCWGGDGARPPGLWHCILQRLATALFAGASLFAIPAVA